MHRFYWPPEETPITGEGVPVRGDLATHFAATRLDDGEAIECFNDQGFRSGCRAVKDGRRWLVRIDPDIRLPDSPVPARRLTVWMAAFDPSRFDWAAEKLTELGVAAIGVFPAQRSNAPVRGGDRLRRLMIRAAEQSGRTDIPGYRELKSLEEIPEGAFLLEIPGRIPTRPLASAELPGELHLVVGPEGGWSDAERKWILGRPSVRPVHLVNTSLRAETAAIAAAALVLGR